MRILVVDDEMVSRAKLQVIMRNIGECEAVDNGGEAVEVAVQACREDRPFDLICMDVNMPDMDGYQACERLKADPATRNIPVIFVTAEDETAQETKGFELGAADFIKKPFNPAVVKARAQTHLDLKRHRDRLEQMVADRTARLEEANRRLAALDREKLAFLRYLCHEMNTPLNWIGATNIMDRTQMGQENQELLVMVEKGFQRLSRFVQAVVSYFEIAGGDLHLDVKDVRVRPLIERILEDMAPVIDSSGVRVIADVGESLVVKADPEWFKVLLTVLIENAVAFSEKGGDVGVRSHTDSRQARLLVSDHGRGIAPEHVKEVFKAFSIQDCYRRPGGYGLNLPRARLIAEAHGWTIRVESPGGGQGTTVSLIMPL
ncbi:MAG: hybrid sensor histidine kinase/response regulator [Deltaproteobacteria bacterium]|nr:hybrid sensor histidine kinase/response regulator [Deltaproteobacteria bacterium]